MVEGGDFSKVLKHTPKLTLSMVPSNLSARAAFACECGPNDKGVRVWRNNQTCSNCLDFKIRRETTRAVC